MKDGKFFIKDPATGEFVELKKSDGFELPGIIILGKGPVAGKPFQAIKTKEDIPGYDGETVWTVGTHVIKDADGYLCLHDEDDHGKPLSLAKNNSVLKQKETPLINNSISIMILGAFSEGYTDIRVAGAPMRVGSEYTDQRESLFQVMGYIKAQGASIAWDDDEDYNNFYSEKLGFKYV